MSLALLGKPECPRGFQEKKLRNDCEFNRQAGITAENEHLAGFGQNKTTKGLNIFSAEDSSPELQRLATPTLPQLVGTKINSVVQ